MIDSYLPRVIEAELADVFSGVAALSIEGAKAIGKTATALRSAETIFRLNRAADRDLFGASASALGDLATPVLLDEWQRYPESWEIVKDSVDDDPTPGRFLLTGSATPLDRTTHSGAGRIVVVRMRPMSLYERRIDTATVSLADLLSGRQTEIGGTAAVGIREYVAEILSSGFPGIRALRGRARQAQLAGYVARIVDHDLPELGFNVRHPQTLARWLTAYAAASSTTAKYEQIRDAATAGEGDKPAKTTSIAYRSVLEKLWIIEEVPAWLPTRNVFGRLSAPPKHHLVDPALAASLLGATEQTLIGQSSAHGNQASVLVGRLFESLVTQSIRVYAQHNQATVHHLRTWSGDREIDLIVERADGAILAVEIKLSEHVTDHDVRHLRWLKSRIGDDLVDAVVVTAGSSAYRRPDGIGVCPAALLMP